MDMIIQYYFDIDGQYLKTDICA